VFCARRQHGPADDQFLVAGALLIDQKAHLHVEPAVLLAQSAFERNVSNVGLVLVQFFIPPKVR
jgi:hypothetical protein